MCPDCYEDPEDQVEDFPAHGNDEEPGEPTFVDRSSDPRDFIAQDVGGS